MLAETRIPQSCRHQVSSSSSFWATTVVQEVAAAIHLPEWLLFLACRTSYVAPPSQAPLLPVLLVGIYQDDRSLPLSLRNLPISAE
jgi:hypothetical protein